MIGLALGHEHRSYKGKYADLDAQIAHQVKPKARRGRVAAMIMSALGIFS